MRNKSPNWVRRLLGIVPPGTLADDGHRELERLGKTLTAFRDEDGAVVKKNVAVIQAMILPVLLASIKSHSTNMTPSAPSFFGLIWAGMALYAIGETLHFAVPKLVPQLASSLIVVGGILFVAMFIAIIGEFAVFRKPNDSRTDQHGRIAETLCVYFSEVEINVWVQQRDSSISFYGAIAGGLVGVLGIIIGAAVSLYPDAAKPTLVTISGHPVADLILYLCSGLFGVAMAAILKAAYYTRTARLAAAICKPS